MFQNLFKTALRTIIKDKIYTLINIAGLAIGLSACMILFMWIDYHLSFDMFHKNADRICRPILDINLPGIDPNKHCGSLGVMGPSLVDEYPEIESCVRLFRRQSAARVRYGDAVQSDWRFFYTDVSFFDLFSFEMKYGDPALALKHPNSMVLVEDAALALFGDINPLGNVVEIEDDMSYTITGVLKKLPSNSHLQFEALAIYDNAWLTNHIKNHPYDAEFLTYLLLAPGADLKELDRKMDGFVQKYLPELAHGLKMFFQPLKRIHLFSSNLTYNHMSWRSLDIEFVYVFSAIAILILLIAAINYINLSTARTRQRAKEVGIRKAVGATRNQIIRQFIGESVLLSFAAMLVGYTLIETGLPLLNLMFKSEFDFGPVNRLQLFGFIIALTLFVGIVTGWYPAIVLSMPKPQETLKIFRNKGVRGLSLRRGLVVVQFCITMILIIFGFTIEKQLSWIQRKNLGFNKEQVLSFKMPAAVQMQFESIRHELLQNSWVSDVSALGPFNFPGFQGKRIEFEGKIDEEWWLTACTAVDYNFVKFYGLQIVEGRDFSRSLETDRYSAYIINEALKKKLGWETAVGKKFQIPEHKEKPGQVVGVVKDFNWRSLHESVDGCVLFLKPEALNFISVRTRADQISTLLSNMRHFWERYAPNAAFEYSFLDDSYARFYNPEQRIRQILNVFSILAMVVASMGLLGLISFTTEQRTKEIGIRKVLGASVGNVLIILSQEFFILLSVAVFLAWPVAWMLTNRWLESFAYRAPVSLEVYFIAWGITLCVALLTIAGRVIKAARANPVESLRYE